MADLARAVGTNATAMASTLVVSTVFVMIRPRPCWCHHVRWPANGHCAGAMSLIEGFRLHLLGGDGGGRLDNLGWQQRQFDPEQPSDAQSRVDADFPTVALDKAFDR